jgi:hypothetical protein
MRVRYPETDSLCIDLVDRPGVDSIEVAQGIDIDEDGRPVRIDGENTSVVADLKALESIQLPLGA